MEHGEQRGDGDDGVSCCCVSRGGVTESTGVGDSVEVTSQALTSVDVDRVLGFEAATVTDWAIIQSGPGTLSVSTTASEGSRSLAVASHGYVPVQSVALTSLGSRVGSAIHYDIMLPTELKQISPKNYGATQLYLNSTSLGLNNTYLGQVELTPLPLGQWNTVTFTPTSAVLTKLRGTYSDLRVTIVVNAPYNATKPYLLDNLRFSDSTLALVTVVDGGGHPLSGLTVVAYNGSTPTTNTGVTDSTGLAKVWVPTGSYRFAVTEAGVTTYSSATNQCQVPGVCAAVTITAKCHGIVCTARDSCHNVGICDPGTGTCSNPAKPAGTVCRPVAGLCDVAEVCDGSDAGCPVDAFLQASLACRPAAGLCDVAEVCSGTSAACPVVDAFLPSSTVCRAAAGVCDVAENCTGTAAACPPDVLASASTVCRASTGACDPAETCTGGSPTCPTDVTTGAPPAPSGLAAMVGDGKITLTWTGSSGAGGYNVKRGRTSGGPYSTLFTSTGPSYTDTGLTNHTAYYYVVSAVSSCGESANSGEVPGVPSAAIPPRSLPKAPSEVGCYWYTANGWETLPCEPVSDVISSVGAPVIPPALSSPYVEATPNPTTSPNKVLVPPTSSTPLPFVFAQAEILFPVIGSVTNVVSSPPSTFPGCLTSGSPTLNALSVQLNTNKFMMTNGHNGAVQFAIQSAGLDDPAIHMCAWQNDVTDQSYDDTSVCVKAPPPTRDTPLKPFDFVNIAGSVDAAAGTMSIVVQLSWVEPGWPNIYAQTGIDKYGLANHWFEFDAAMLGLGGCTEAEFEDDASVVTRLMGSTCPGVTSATSSTSGCPTDTLEPHASFENRKSTAETNNLLQIGTPSVSYPNPYLAVTNVTATTSGSCIDPKHIYVRDYETDSGAVPSNAAGQAFWESPDIFLVPKDSPVDPYSTPAQSLITPNTDFDVWVRVHNDLGCAPVTGAKALVYIADPSALSTAWNSLTNNLYLAATSAGNTVAAGDRSLIGPFHYHAPLSGYGDGHKCLIAAIIAEGEPEVDNYFDAPNSNQVAQRNVEFQNCAFPLTNATGSDGEVEIALRVVPPETSPSLSPTGTNISFAFDDSDSQWHDVWVAQPENGTAYSVSRTSDGKTTVRLGKASLTLHAVPLHDGESRTARGNLAGLPAGAPLTTLSL